MKKILEDYYPSHERDLVIWQEAAIKHGNKYDEHIDSLIIDRLKKVACGAFELQNAKTRLRESFVNLCEEKSFEIAFNGKVCIPGNVSNVKHYYLMCAAFEI